MNLIIIYLAFFPCQERVSLCIKEKTHILQALLSLEKKDINLELCVTTCVTYFIFLFFFIFPLALCFVF